MNEIKKFEPLWGSWYVKDIIGEGSFGKVYRIERTEFGNTYTAALKHIRVPQSQSEVKSIMADGMTAESVETYFEDMVEDIVGEFVLMSKLKGNSHVVSYEDHKVVKDENQIGWDIFIRMELLTSLLDYIHDNNISKRDVIKLGIDMCKALELCQKYNIIHRDIKPENIFVSESGDYKLGDFGIARQVEKTVAGLSKKGTFTYIAPEVYKGEAYGSTVDIYSLGIVMYRLLNNNRVPFMPPYPAVINHADREMALVKRMSGKPIEKPVNADGRLAEIVLKACAFNPADRYNIPLLMRMELEAILYDAAEKKVIYPHGDKAEQHSVKYVKTEDDYTATLQNTQYRIENNETQLMTEFPKSAAEETAVPEKKDPKPEPEIKKPDITKWEITKPAEKESVFKATPEKTKSSKLPVVIICTVVLVIIAAAAAVSLLKDSQVSRKNKVEETKTEVTTEGATETTSETTTEAPTETTTETTTEAPTETTTSAPVYSSGGSSSSSGNYYSGGSGSSSGNYSGGSGSSSSGSSGSSGGSSNSYSSGSSDSSSGSSSYSDNSSGSSDSSGSSGSSDSSSGDDMPAPELFMGFA